MPLNYERVKLEHLGRGGTAQDIPLVDEVQQHLERLAMLAVDDLTTGDGVLTIKIRVKKAGEESVILAYTMQVKDPPMARKALSAIVAKDSGELYAAHHKQEALPLPKAVPLRKATNGTKDEGGE